jgi:succinate dehydrogenase / fumarate reductase membrane anchor subunit
MLLVFALTHGANGARTVIDDYVERGLKNVVAKWALYVVIALFILMGAHIIFTFDPGTAG